MAQGKVSVAALNTGSGATKEVERTMLFVGVAATVSEQIEPINAQSDFDAQFGEADSDLKTQLKAWVRNGDDLVSGYALAINESDNVFDAINKAMDENIYPEMIAICLPVTGKAEVEAYQGAALEMLSKHARYLRLLIAVPGIDSLTQTWSEYNASLTPISDGVVAVNVALIPQIHGDELGAVAGRLCKRSVTIADSPMRVLTGAMSLSPAPLDKNGAPLTNATLAALDAQRFSCTQYYPGFDGTYFGDVQLLDAEGGDFQTIEIGRIVDKAAREVRIKAIHQIKNRRLNNSPSGIAFGKRVLGKPLRDMSKPINIGADKFPGDIRPPKDDAVSLTFMNERQLRVILKVQPVDSPSEILVGIMLDRSE
ncbi:DUF2586 domain-containing protein [uncultured Shewanella sp.]|uniref:DUF2586 domain-containing protein n=1 Tax=uncultured Shewanella sp. TaxID=173975 RepID=UPI00262F52D8|nr:DUF2586 domain-containing protein [uncultured Shewanella sp.]